MFEDTSLEEFCARHLLALEKNEARHMMMLGVLNGTAAELARVLFWTLGDPGECAVLRSSGLVILGDLNAVQSRAIAERLSNMPYKGVIGPDESALHFKERATEFGAEFLDPMPQCIQSLAEPPKHPDAPGCARRATAEDTDLLMAWMAAFVHEATA